MQKVFFHFHVNRFSALCFSLLLAKSVFRFPCFSFLFFSVSTDWPRGHRMRLLIRRNTNGRARTVMLFNNRCFHTPYAQVTGGGRAGGGFWSWAVVWWLGGTTGASGYWSAERWRWSPHDISIRISACL